VPGVIESSYHANRMFVGHHIESGDQQFQVAEATFSYSTVWFAGSGIKVETDYFRDRADPAAIYAATFTPNPQGRLPIRPRS
jgi:hypothetical protein